MQNPAAADGQEVIPRRMTFPPLNKQSKEIWCNRQSNECNCVRTPGGTLSSACHQMLLENINPG